jgi:uncharacterized metal-binding protein
MPSGKVHDAITLGLAVPAFGVSYLVSNSLFASLICGSAFLFGGLMFGPDLDTVSRPYSRWGPLRVYFLGSVTLLVFIAGYLYQASRGGQLPGVDDIAGFWRPVGETVRERFGENLFIIVFAGLWAGAASHTFTDMAGSFIRTGRSGKFF